MKTKNISIYMLTVVLTAGIVTSCKDFLNVNPVTSFGPNYVFNDVPNATKAVLGAYSPLGGDAGYGIRISMYYAYDNDEMMGQGSTPYNDNERRDIAHYSVQPSNTQLAGPFNQLYLGIERANICIYYIPKMDKYTSGSAAEQTDLKRLHGEALTLRAQYYYELIRNWGDVPAQYLPSSFESELFKSRTDRNSIYDHLLADLADASALVPWRSQVTADERITQGAVRALRARIALARGGYSLVGSSMQRSTDYKSFYQIAKDECAAIIASNEHHLNPSFKSVFKDAITAHALEPNGEIIWAVAMSGGNSGAGDSKLGYYNGPRVNANGNGALTILPTYFYLFASTDTRRDVTCAPYDVNLNGTLAPRPLTTMVDGKFRRDWITNPAPSPTSTQQYFGLSWPLIRYSDVLLMHAEAENEIAGAPTPLGTASFNQVRLRGFGGNALAAGIASVPLDYTGFFNAIVTERSLELGGEGIRKYDLIRWNMLASRLAATKADLANMALSQGTFAVGTLPPSTIGMAPPPTVGGAGVPTTIFVDVTSTSATGIKFFGASKFDFQLLTPAPATSFVTVTWVGYPVTNPQTLTPATTITTTLSAYFAEAFKANKSELLPLATSVVDANPNLGQNPGF